MDDCYHFFEVDEGGFLVYDMRVAFEADPDFLEECRNDPKLVLLPGNLAGQVTIGWHYDKVSGRFDPPEPEPEITSSMILEFIVNGINQV